MHERQACCTQSEDGGNAEPSKRNGWTDAMSPVSDRHCYLHIVTQQQATCKLAKRHNEPLTQKSAACRCTLHSDQTGRMEMELRGPQAHEHHLELTNRWHTQVKVRANRAK